MCPECPTELPGRDHTEARVWRHLDTCQFQTLVHAQVPRIDCPTHGVRQVVVPWATARSRFTLLMERLIIDLIQQCSTVTGACRIARVTWDEAWGIMARAVGRGQPAALHHRDLLSLRRPRSLPTLNPEGPEFLIQVAPPCSATCDSRLPGCGL